MSIDIINHAEHIRFAAKVSNSITVLSHRETIDIDSGQQLHQTCQLKEGIENERITTSYPKE